MDTKKLEHWVILLLLTLNLFLLAAVLRDETPARRVRRDTVEMLTALLEEAGITVGPEAELIQNCPAQCQVRRNMDQEQWRVQRLIGAYRSEDLGGSIWFYRSAEAQVVMRGTGEMDILFSAKGGPRAAHPEKTAKRLLAKADVALSEEGAQPQDGRLVLCCCWNGYPVYNAQLTFDFSAGRLELVSGTMVFSEETERGEAGMDSASVLVRFLELVRNEGLICSRLERVTPGYRMNVAMSGESVLTPVWRIETDTGALCINAVNGAMESLR